MKNRTKVAILALSLTAGIYALNVTNATPQPFSHAPKLGASITRDIPQYVDHRAVLDALATETQLVGLVGNASKTVEYVDDKWYGAKAYVLTLNGEFKLGVDTADLDVTTRGNTITVRLPQTKLISADFPFDQAQISKAVGLVRKDLDEGELQALYGLARDGAIADIEADEVAHGKAQDGVKLLIDSLLGAVEHVDEINYEMKTEE